MADLSELAPEGELDDIGAELSAAFASANADDLGTGADVPPVSGDDPAPAVEPAEKPTRTAAERARDQLGRFATGEAQKPSGEPAVAAPKPNAATPAAAAQPDPAAPPQDGELRPPPGWSPTSKAEFAKLPEHVKRDIVKRETEVNAGFAKLQEFKDLEPLANYAKQRNATPAQYFGMLANAEARLEKDPSTFVATLMRDFKVEPLTIVRALGITPEYLVGMANHMAGNGQRPQVPQPQGQPQADGRAQQMMQQLWNEAQQAKRAAAEAKQAIDQIRMEPVQQKAREFLINPKFPYAQNLIPQIRGVLERGEANSYEDAYDIAVYANPETRKLVINSQREDEGRLAAERARTAASNARAGARSVTGSPLPGASSSPDLSDLSLEDQLRAAFRGTV